jgi:tRNA(fMet)-specific endonuclease VapC
MAQLAISAVSEADLHCGVARRRDVSQLGTIVKEFLLRPTILSWDSQEAQEYGQLCATREGQPMGNVDMMVGAQALALDLILVTNDHAFKKISRFQEPARWVAVRADKLSSKRRREIARKAPAAPMGKSKARTKRASS